MRDPTSPQHFDFLQATASIVADVTLEDASSFLVFETAVEEEKKEDGMLMAKLAVLFGRLAGRRSAHSKKLTSTSMPATHAVELPPPVRFSRTIRRPIPSQRSDRMNS